jgi:proline dehydrogenase
MLGEAALTRADAERYREKYAAAIAAVGKAVETREIDHRAPQHLHQALRAASAL